MAASTISATSAGVATSMVSRKSGSTVLPPVSGRSAGRLRRASRILVGTWPGHSTVTPTSGATVANSRASVSDSPTTACFEALYAACPPPGIVDSPATEAVLTTCP